MAGLAPQSVRAAQRANPPWLTAQIQPAAPVGGFLRTSMGWRWHTCAGPGYPLQPNTVSTKLRPLWSTPGNGFGTYSLCPHGVLFMPSRLAPVGPSPGAPRSPPPPPSPVPIPRRGGGSNQVPPRPIRTNSVPVLPPTPLTTPSRGDVQSILMEANRVLYPTNRGPFPPLPPTHLTPLLNSQGSVSSLAGERQPLPESTARRRRAQR
jgi:hypothetical protein